MARGPNHIADKKKDIIVYVDTRLPNEPAHCHLSYKGIDVGQILLEAETKEKAFKKGGILGIFGKKDLRAKFEFVPIVEEKQLEHFIERYHDDCYRNAASNASDEEVEKNANMIEVATRFAKSHIELLLQEQASLSMRK
ncbi:hypothetical protein IKP94_01180 [Candidatus Saccharibacteria bacterium]|nr:hypothetical protein [Candidatus Saccharibacteria bacterium]MBR6964898.1 hypothetical protein [Candidatus Saccharibacteria bacterium]